MEVFKVVRRIVLCSASHSIKIGLAIYDMLEAGKCSILLQSGNEKMERKNNSRSQKVTPARHHSIKNILNVCTSISTSTITSGRTMRTAQVA
jgi:hypothetical protein